MSKDRGTDEIDPDAADEFGSAGACELLGDDVVADGAAGAAAVFLRPGDADPTTARELALPITSEGDLVGQVVEVRWEALAVFPWEIRAEPFSTLLAELRFGGIRRQVHGGAGYCVGRQTETELARLKNWAALPILQGMTGVRFFRRGRDQRGFTLVEALLVTAVIGVLLVIAIPSFLGTRARVQDRSAQANLRVALTNAKALYADTESFAKITATTLHDAETSLDFTSAPSTAPNMVSVHSGSGGIVLAAQSRSGVCYVVGDAANAAGAVFQNVGTASCAAASITSLPNSPPTDDTASPGSGWAKAW